MYFRRAVVALAAACSLGTAAAADFPDKMVKLIVPFSAGGNTDNLTRIFAEGLAAKWGQTVVVENKPGAGATIGAAHVARSAPDGHTLLLGSVGMATNQFLFRDMPYEPKSLTPLVLVAQGPNVLFVRPNLPVKSVPELIKYAKENPGGITFASSGVGTSPHLAAELFAYRADINIIHVPYKGANPAANDLMGGQVDAFFSVLNLMPHVEQGRIRALAVTSEARISEVPELPTVDEAGGTNGVVSGTWFGFFVPSDTPDDVKKKIVETLHEVAQEKSTQEKIAALALSPAYLGPEDFARFIKREEDRWSEVIEKQKISIN
ncbi:tripartite tricarboxylate transporter substrate binding protein [Alcaligenaceae bacterium]|nr:tripartite tricarboxylate transporter substrate binding protein [Alcaligenaceae bacterium]